MSRILWHLSRSHLKLCSPELPAQLPEGFGLLEDPDLAAPGFHLQLLQAAGVDDHGENGQIKGPGHGQKWGFW
ncbi:MAG: hypothetical protein C0630_10600 [Sedimenticola selenatireducens]|uniref:Uncharacterized protein n=1 Tax=Sedimenticola selenatireducens TaxID=191960 RepID=A0A2N6CWG3_9GAMM|nr:MAG: hypothetical protein C0630_10600 [Sedimenticola selenatireducens]